MWARTSRGRERRGCKEKESDGEAEIVDGIQEKRFAESRKK